MRVLSPEGQSPPRVSLFAQRQDEPTYTRGTNSGGEAVVILRGLGAGRFSLTCSPIMGGVFTGGDQAGKRSIVREVELDGHSTIELALDLR